MDEVQLPTYRRARRRLMQELWETGLLAKKAGQYAVASLTFERMARMEGFLSEKPAPGKEAGERTVFYTAEPLTSEEWAEKYGTS